ncbi:type II secretion system F family protein [Serpentinicella alkaliphila]|uniref:Tight adherence protein B n=1 Tax=Serpentinicella alkaliphila TaxID=1734049 RepID=A0A4R2TV35_9FIRM|nr:type II secretion system F family protein [Serpentinicella alkaliphila]QUH27004.1 type II secretion system F family protein [Serpentinicella alkaliphila]TCQ01499.1 tight adherence protein B [Serpentinicella alkaliphila]
MEPIISTLVFMTVLLSLLGLYLSIGSKKSPIALRLKNYSELHKNAFIEESKENQKISKKNILRIIGKFFVTVTLTKKLENQLLKAEIPMRGEEFLGLNILGLIFSVIIGGVILGGVGPILILSILCVSVPQVIIQRKRRTRAEKINLQIGDCLTVMANSLRAGYSFQQAIDLVGKEMNGPLANELRKTNREINLGTTIDDALINLTKRAESEDLELLITAVLIQRQIGGNLAEILDNISFTIRERIRIKGEIKTLTAQGRISGLIIGLMPPILFAILMLINPSYMNVMVKSRVGLMILFGGLLSEIVGVILIKRVVDIEV